LVRVVVLNLAVTWPAESDLGRHLDLDVKRVLIPLELDGRKGSLNGITLRMENICETGTADGKRSLLGALVGERRNRTVFVSYYLQELCFLGKSYSTLID